MTGILPADGSSGHTSPAPPTSTPSSLRRDSACSLAKLVAAEHQRLENRFTVPSLRYSFATGRLSQLTVHPARTHDPLRPFSPSVPTGTSPPKTAKRRRWGGLTFAALGVAIGLVTAGLIGIVASPGAVATREQPERPELSSLGQSAPNVVGTATERLPPKRRRPSSAAAQPADATEREPTLAEDSPAPPIPSATREPEPQAVSATPPASPKQRAESSPPRPRRPAKPRSAIETAASAPTPKAAKPPAQGLSAECIIDPTRCKNGAAPAVRTQPTPGAPVHTLPDKLSAHELRTALTGPKAAAQACSVHASSSGQRVRVKLSISGKTGAVTSATPLSPAANTEVGRCVARALSQAKFPRFSRPAMGVVYGVRL